MTGAAKRYGIEKGQVYLACDGSKAGHWVLDVERFEACDDVLTWPFNASGFKSLAEGGNRIDAFKLACVRYSLAQQMPSWMPPLPEGLTEASKSSIAPEPQSLQAASAVGPSKTVNDEPNVRGSLKGPGR